MHLPLKIIISSKILKTFLKAFSLQCICIFLNKSKTVRNENYNNNKIKACDNSIRDVFEVICVYKNLTKYLMYRYMTVTF